MEARAERGFDLIVFGATSFVGQILLRYLVERHGTHGDLKWAIAGRNPEKLASVAADTGAEVEQIIADAHDRTALASMCESTRVLISTVGPYALYGSEVVAAAATAGTDYCDLTGEPHFMRRMIDTHLATAEATGARIVHACGFDSVPSDLGVFYTQSEAERRFGDPCNEIRMRVKTMKGGVSGGTVASMVNVVEEVSRDPELRKILANPFSLAPESMRSGPRQPRVTAPANDEVSGGWIAPFVMADVNTRVVHRTHALLGRPWGEDFIYEEALATGRGPLGGLKAAGVAGGMLGGMGLLAVGPVRKVLSDHVLPSPGDGPNASAQASGFYDLRFYGSTDGGRSIRTKVTGDRDPGYGSTAKILGEAAVCLLDTAQSKVAGGFWTPATAMGSTLIERLEAHAGLSFSVVD